MKTYKNANRTEKWIRQAFVELIAEKKNLEKITVSEIVERADITKPTFYYHYSDLNDLVKSIENEMIEELDSSLNEVKKSGEDSIERYIATVMSFLKSKEDEYKILANAADLHYFITKIKKVLAKKLETSQFGFSQDETVREIQTVFISGACVDVLLEYFKGGFNCSLETINSIIAEACKKLTR